MGYETAQGQVHEPEPEIGISPEAASVYDTLAHAELIDQFYVTEGDPDIGRELSVRLFAHADFADDPRTAPLIGGDGAQVQEDGQPLKLADYVNFAARHHFEALESILDFLLMTPGTQDYETMRATMLGRLSPGKS
jgi:hypothetical protein